jgi:hypothetical protein
MGDLLQIASYGAPALIATATIPVVWRFAKNIRRAKPVKNEGLYEDKDGKATEESMAKYSTKKSFILIFIGVGVGVAASFALFVNSFIQVLEYREPPLIWVLFGSWVCEILFQYSDDVLTECRFWL